MNTAGADVSGPVAGEFNPSVAGIRGQENMQHWSQLGGVSRPVHLQTKTATVA